MDNRLSDSIASLKEMFDSHRYAAATEETLQSMELDEALLVLNAPFWEDSDFATLVLCLRKHAKPPTKTLLEQMCPKPVWAEEIMFAADVLKECKFLSEPKHVKQRTPILLYVYAIARLLRETPPTSSDVLERMLKDYKVPGPTEIKRRAWVRYSDIVAADGSNGSVTVKKEKRGEIGEFGSVDVKNNNMPCPEWHAMFKPGARVKPPQLSHYPYGAAAQPPQMIDPLPPRKRPYNSIGVQMPGYQTPTPGSVQSNYGGVFPPNTSSQTQLSSTSGRPPAPNNPHLVRFGKNTCLKKARTGACSPPADPITKPSTTTASSSAVPALGRIKMPKPPKQDEEEDW
ncbi:uncharacterized protein F4807DRAFT_253465 [Annulohypoxylon truncatum]|uniref:uncharacterized protein n=1 Tax=Annulohypoxylon truncatum TaxID=327061 RepID=UPI002007615A|nr:uncharacterized protein F4807DRAFT_253465 [Annulohypoxylon truncatum]KAI1205816.1 hypothetical protein F4807DRAFT_253465 [Annulohypoxylon truncatum]